MIKRAYVIALLLAACGADDLQEPEIDVITMAVAEACPYVIGAYNTTDGWGGWFTDTTGWTVQPGQNLADNWCGYKRTSGLTHLFWNVQAGGGCARVNSTVWNCWGPTGGSYGVWCPGNIRPTKPYGYRPSINSPATLISPWRSDWTTYETSVPMVQASGSTLESNPNRIRCDYPQPHTLWFWRP